MFNDKITLELHAAHTMAPGGGSEGLDVGGSPAHQVQGAVFALRNL
jgi:hypothetical protein